jgi:hypothetical protein
MTRGLKEIQLLRGKNLSFVQKASREMVRSKCSTSSVPSSKAFSDIAMISFFPYTILRGTGIKFLFLTQQSLNIPQSSFSTFFEKSFRGAQDCEEQSLYVSAFFILA